MNLPRSLMIAVLGLAVPALPSCEPAKSCGPASAAVERVIDGDTVVLRGGQRVRYLNVDTPESTAKNGKECFGSEASEYNSGRVEGREVQLTYDSQCLDQYGRLLAHVWADGTDVGLDEVGLGYAYAMILPPNVDGREAFEAAEEIARAHGMGLWSACR